VARLGHPAKHADLGRLVTTTYTLADFKDAIAHAAISKCVDMFKRVTLDNGGTVMIGGIYETLERVEEFRVPVLGSLPVLGALFRSRTKSLSRD
jgi:hypothetical protein